MTKFRLDSWRTQRHVPRAEPTNNPVPLSVALLNRRSLGGAVVVMVCALFFILALPALGEMVAQDDIEVGSPLQVGEELTVTPGSGWALSPHSTDSYTALTNSGAQLIITPAKPLTEPVSDQIQATADALANDPDKSWVVAKPTTINTAAGDSGATVTAQSKEATTQTWIIVHGRRQVTFVLVAPLAVWEKVTATATAIVESARFVETAEP